LAVAPEIQAQEIHIRPSQYKFPAKHHGLEVIRSSQYVTATLNRQIIILLSALGVPDSIFGNMLKTMLSDLEKAMVDKTVAINLLQKNIDFNQSTLVLAAMILDGFMEAKDPFMLSMLRLWRSWTAKYLKEKAKIFVSDGASLLGCVDEYGVLKGHSNSARPLQHASMEAKIDALPEIFVQIDPKRDGSYRVLEGTCILARNPSLHPGDVRVVKAVDKPELRHLKNVVVLPQTGDRDLASMCSGGDLDGDDYLVIWDPTLIPKEWNHPPMDFTPIRPATLRRDVEVKDITAFFVQYMKNDHLPTIAHAHLCWADLLDKGIKDEKCM
jgi:RNA-dependent RNA polymerase